MCLRAQICDVSENPACSRDTVFICSEFLGVGGPELLQICFAIHHLLPERQLLDRHVCSIVLMPISDQRTGFTALRF
jgi:hypothetical protein